MLDGINWNWSLDGWIVLAGVLNATASALLGCFLVLRRLSMLGDAISHAVLPGLAAAFLISNSRSSVTMFIGAVVVGILTAMLTEWIRSYGHVDEGASMGVVFTTLFALGLVMIVQAADHVDLDPDCVLHGAIESIALDTWRIGTWEVPRVVVVLSGVTLVNLLFVVCFFKELKLSAFDPALATTSGFNAAWMHYLLMTLVAVTAVASFESVGNILVVAMLVVPAAAAYMLTDRLSRMIVISVVIGAVSAPAGHVGAMVVPAWFGFRSTTTAGMMAVATGVIFVLAALFAPQRGVLSRWAHQRRLSLRIVGDHVLALLYRREEAGESGPVGIASIRDVLLAGRLELPLAVWWQRRSGRLSGDFTHLQLTPHGRTEAAQLIRSHRLWERYMADMADVPSEKTHATADRFEHFTDRRLRQQLDEATDSPTTDPHGRPIPDRR